MLTRTEWYVVPLVWVPIFSVLFLRSALQFADRAPESMFQSAAYTPPSILAIPPSAFGKTVASFLVGNVIWTLLEYFLHRFLFHIDKWLPDRPFFLMLHFLLHGIHHYLPMDRYVAHSYRKKSRWNVTLTPSNVGNSLRLVMPPILFFTLQLPFTQLAHAIFPTAVANGIISGAFAFCEFPSFQRHSEMSSVAHAFYRCTVRLHALRTTSHETARIRSSAEKVSPRSPLQKLRARIWRHEQSVGHRI
jgi:4-hydroxysphinganine ceramide fatty acyl 2-hydroxylase